MNGINRACHIAFEVAFVLFFAMVLFAPFQALGTRHLALVQSIDDTHAIIAGDVSGLSAGSEVPLYRFNADWEAPIGMARVEQVGEGAARIAVESETMSWPLGRSGIISQDADGTTHFSLGANAGFVANDTIDLFRNRAPLGQATLTSVDATTSIVQLPIGVGSASGLVGSEYTYATQVALYAHPILTALEYAVIALLLLAYLMTYVRAKRSPFIVLGEMVRRLPLSAHDAFWIVHLLAGVPFAWFIGSMPLYLIAYIAQFIAQHAFSNYTYFFGTAASIAPYTITLVGLMYYGYLGYYKRSPILALWQQLSYRGHARETQPTFVRGLFWWALHLVIVYAFGSTLLGFLSGDLGAAASIDATNAAAWFSKAKYLIWALTVVGVLIGYGYSVVSILWGSYIRRLDFSVVGWLTNGFCYPLFGIVIWQMTPSFSGLDPIATAGPVLYLSLILGLVFNILYMISIFNLGLLFDLMADKGVRWSGFYNVVRHPNYTLEASMFFTTALVGLTTGTQWLGIMMYFFLYWIRSEREDNFMEYSNPEYRDYQKATPWKFIPGIY